MSQFPKGLSPFDRAIMLGWHDGPTEGLVRCSTCNRIFRFVMLDSLDEDREIRIYSLAPLARDSWERLIIALSPFMAPIWPMWVPRWKFPSEADRIAVERVIDDLFTQADHPDFVVVTPALLDEIHEAKLMSSSEAPQVHDWVSWMGLARATLNGNRPDCSKTMP
jgi:hypothetical protein